jgi:hypothetical protein
MSTDAKSLLPGMSHAKASAADAAKGFGGLYQGVMKPGAIGVREKERVAIGIGLALRCEPVHLHPRGKGP